MYYCDDDGKVHEIGNVKIYFYENDELASLLKRSPHRMDDLLEALNDAGKCSKTHFSPTGFKTDLELEELTDIYSRL